LTLRVSLTDRCNLRCIYCMSEEGLQWLGKPELLTDDEIFRMVWIAVTLLGVKDVRFTGGEPLLSPGLVECCAALEPRRKMSIRRTA
jgi:cyclic pyranopterin phosphate synthase